MVKCKFCEEFEEVKRIHSQSQRENVLHKYGCALVSETYREEERIGKATYGTMELNYCPECGKKIDWKAIKSGTEI